MRYAQLGFFETPKEDLRITPIYEHAQLLRMLTDCSCGGTSLPDAAGYYTTPVVFPQPGQDRPYIVSSIVLSADGKMAYMDNKEGPLIARNNFADKTGGAVDFWCLNMLRAYSDGLLLGANTLRNEPSSINNCMDISLVNQRRDILGKKDQPCQIIVSLDGTDIPFEHPTFRVDTKERLKAVFATSYDGWTFIQKSSPLKHVLVGPFTTRRQVDDAELPALDQDFDTVPIIVTGEGTSPDMALMLYTLRRLGMKTLCVESPTYCAALMDNGFLDEYFINYSMVYVGGVMTPGNAYPKGFREHPHADLVSVGIHKQNFLFTRQLLRYDISPDDK